MLFRSISARMMTCPSREKAVAVSATVSPVTQTADVAVKSASMSGIVGVSSPKVARGSISANVPSAMAMRNESETVAEGESVLARVEIFDDEVGACRQDHVQQEGRHQHDDGGKGEDVFVGLGRVDVFFLEELERLGDELKGAVRTREHGAETALHEGHHLEEEQVDEDERGDRDDPENHNEFDRGLLPVGERRHLSMSPRMKYSEARMVMTSGT